MTAYDYLVIVFYFGLLVSVGLLTSRWVTNTSDYFRGGGSMVWWIVGSSAFMNQFSAWTFTGAASKAYEEGWLVLTIYFGNGLGFLANYLYFAARTRQMRVITTIEAVRERFGAATQQFYTWLGLPLGIFSASIWLNGLCLFIALAFGLPLETTIIATGVVVVVYTLLGGAWASTANDFVQVLVLMPVTVVAAVLAVAKLGGVAGFVEAVPAGHLDWHAPFASGLLLFWCLTNLVRQFINCNNLLEAGRYLSVKNSDHARKAALLAAVLSVVGPVIWFIPPMAARALYPDLAAMFPALRNPSDGAFIAVCLQLMPTGMLGVMICGMLGATVSSMDSGLNRNSGIFVRNFYLPILRPQASERELVVAGRLATMAIGALIIIVALNVSRLKDLGLFEVVQYFGTLVMLPMTIPLMLLVIFPRTPPWSAIVTAMACMAASWSAAHWLTPDWYEGVSGTSITAAQRSYWTVSLGVVVNAVVGGIVFCASRLAWGSVPPHWRDRIENFDFRMRQPISPAEADASVGDARQAQVMGRTALAFAGLLAAMILIPNQAPGRLAFAFCAASVAIMGVLLWRRGRCSNDS